MEYVEGHTVHEHLVKEGPYSESAALSIAIQVAKALNHAHQLGIVHRDVKPKNILITDKGVAKLADMGLARSVSDREAAEAEAGKAFGTPYYISPEQIRGDINIDSRSDVYGFGATLYHMVTGKAPFDGPDVRSVMKKHLSNPLVPPDHVNSDLSNGISEIIELCLAKDPNNRYASTADLIEDIQSVIDGLPPIYAHKLIDISDLKSLEEGGKIDESYEIEDEVSYVSMPLFWIAVVGWSLVAVLLVVIIIMSIRHL